jgi:hypothetical protein
MSPGDAIDLAIRPALRLLPQRMASRSAVAMLVAIGLQESRFTHRRQTTSAGGFGPARGWWQFEASGVRGVVTHAATSDLADAVATRLGYRTATWGDLHLAIQHNDVLAAAFARLNLWWLPAPLPEPDDVDGSWWQYLEAWRPGKPCPDTWPRFFARGWEIAREWEG